jgi:RNA polymerase sigma-70 factor, ECF subfamily
MGLAAPTSPRFASLALDELSDEQLLEGFHQGRQACFETLVRRHEDRIFALGLRMMGNRADALEAVQETFLNLLRRSGSFKGTSSFGTWLYRVGIHTCHDLLRKRNRLPVPAETLPEEPMRQTSVDDTVALRADLASALRSLPDDYREAVLLHDLGGYPYEEIARQTSVPVGTVKSRISRGRRLLAARLEQPGHPSPSKPHAS